MGLLLLIFGLFVFITIMSICVSIVSKIDDRVPKIITADVITRWVYNAASGLAVTICICIFISAVTLGFSYRHYLDDRAAYDSVISQYKQSITLYDDKVIIDMDHAITDLRYTGNAEQVSTLVQQLREQITKYNASIIIKRKLKANFVFSMLVVGPDKEMLPINMIIQPPKGITVE